MSYSEDWAKREVEKLRQIEAKRLQDTVIQCPKCGQIVVRQDWVKFCGRCGERLKQ